MSGGPQVFLGATTFLSDCVVARSPAARDVCGAGLRGVPVGGGPPASRPRCELRSARRLEARPGPAGLAAASDRAALEMTRPPTGTAAKPCSAPRHEARLCPPVPPAPSTPVGPGVLMCGSVRCREAQLWLSFNNLARNSSMAHSNFEFASLELQRFWGVSKNDRDKLRAKCGRRWRRRPWVPQPSPAAHGCRSLAPPWPHRPCLGPHSHRC